MWDVVLHATQSLGLFGDPYTSRGLLCWGLGGTQHTSQGRPPQGIFLLSNAEWLLPRKFGEVPIATQWFPDWTLSTWTQMNPDQDALVTTDGRSGPQPISFHHPLQWMPLLACCHHSLLSSPGT